MRKAVKVMAIFLVVCIAIIFPGCHKKTTTSEVSTDEEAIVDDISSEELEEDMNSLADTCDYIIGEGSDPDGDTYQLVVNKEESLEDVTIKAGVIKNNEWLVEPSEDLPFIDKVHSTLINSRAFSIDSMIKFDMLHCYYVQNGCFVTDDFIYNGETNKVYMIGDIDEYTHKEIDSYEMYYFRDGIFSNINQEVKIVITVYESGNKTFEILDLSEMKATAVDLSKYNLGDIFNEDIIVCPMTDGVFYANIKGKNAEINAFIDESGNKVVDFNEKSYSPIDSTDNYMYFLNGKSTFEARNSSGTEYRVTIDKNGNILEENKISED